MNFALVTMETGDLATASETLNCVVISSPDEPWIGRSQALQWVGLRSTCTESGTGSILEYTRAYYRIQECTRFTNLQTAVGAFHTARNEIKTALKKGTSDKIDIVPTVYWWKALPTAVTTKLSGPLHVITRGTWLQQNPTARKGQNSWL